MRPRRGRASPCDELIPNRGRGATEFPKSPSGRVSCSVPVDAFSGADLQAERPAAGILQARGVRRRQEEEQSRHTHWRWVQLWESFEEGKTCLPRKQGAGRASRGSRIQVRPEDDQGRPGRKRNSQERERLWKALNKGEPWQVLKARQSQGHPHSQGDLGGTAHTCCSSEGPLEGSLGMPCMTREVQTRRAGPGS